MELLAAMEGRALQPSLVTLNSSLVLWKGWRSELVLGPVRPIAVTVEFSSRSCIGQESSSFLGYVRFLNCKVSARIPFERNRRAAALNMLMLCGPMSQVAQIGCTRTSTCGIFLPWVLFPIGAYIYIIYMYIYILYAYIHLFVRGHAAFHVILCIHNYYIFDEFCVCSFTSSFVLPVGMHLLLVI